MTLRHEITRTPLFVRFDASGEAALEHIERFVQLLETSTKVSGDRRVLVDLTRIREDMKFTDHYAIGELLARRLPHVERLASLVRVDRRTGTSEKVANARRIWLRVFVDAAEAIAWLEGAGA